jgi:hypothetical protein
LGVTFTKLDNDIGSIWHRISGYETADLPEVYGYAEFAEFNSNRHSCSGFPVFQESVDFRHSEETVGLMGYQVPFRVFDPARLQHAFKLQESTCQNKLLRHAVGAHLAAFSGRTATCIWKFLSPL